MVAARLSPERLTVMDRVTPVMVESAGTLPAMSNCSSARRSRSSLVRPENSWSHAPELLSSKFSPSPGSMPWAMVLSWLGLIGHLGGMSSYPCQPQRDAGKRSHDRLD